MNLSELQYIADHLHPEECRRLLAALHFNSYEEPNALDQAERKVPKDIPCIQMLLHWNSQKGEGRGETHEVLFHRLNQLGRHDLAEWLGKAVFTHLGRGLERSLDDPFKELSEEDQNERKYHIQPTYEPIDNSDPTEWWAIDSIFYVVLAGLSIVTLFALFAILFSLLRKKSSTRKKKKITFGKKYYEEIENQSPETSDSEERFNISRHIDDV